MLAYEEGITLYEQCTKSIIVISSTNLLVITEEATFTFTCNLLNIFLNVVYLLVILNIMRTLYLLTLIGEIIESKCVTECCILNCPIKKAQCFQRKNYTITQNLRLIKVNSCEGFAVTDKFKTVFLLKYP